MKTLLPSPSFGGSRFAALRRPRFPGPVIGWTCVNLGAEALLCWYTADRARRPNRAPGAVLGPRLQNRRAVAPLSAVTSQRPRGAVVTLLHRPQRVRHRRGDGEANISHPRFMSVSARIAR
ncbi:hypothetical protein PCANC_03015 [Puccinia coronata f. sp. avenae]|uniref:Uncharacterized protein n=1 Tax=Puccinia coronata f. sp. avenae TaxID=200324 RepID=A0A2N5UXK1_9BASI|nr:hypothetical protein PCANC_26025 [Puccinia coronata f. sp. avenae]PLW42473.1 hypothetical protein PCASD_04643 [Puccinia coronata f. sp. avenae]PLW56004.1 hypothetical protein PCANC_03015 [Puccinia coronata f. sp. avenae]